MSGSAVFCLLAAVPLAVGLLYAWDRMATWERRRRARHRLRTGRKHCAYRLYPDRCRVGDDVTDAPPAGKATP